MADEATLRERFEDDPCSVVGFATTEHTALVSERTATISETNGRASVFLATVSATLVALALVGDASRFGDELFAFGAVALLAAALVGAAAFARCLQASVHDLRLAARIETVRAMYVTLIPPLSERLDAARRDAPVGRLRRERGMAGRGWWQLFATLVGLVALLESVVVGALGGFVVQLVGGGTEPAVVVALVLTLAAGACLTVLRARAFSALDDETRSRRCVGG